MRTFTLDQQRKNRKTVYTLYEIQPTGPARRLSYTASRVRLNKEIQYKEEMRIYSVYALKWYSFLIESKYYPCNLISNARCTIAMHAHYTGGSIVPNKFVRHNFCIKPYVPREPRRDPGREGPR